MQSTGNDYQPVFIVTLDTYVVSKEQGHCEALGMEW